MTVVNDKVLAYGHQMTDGRRRRVEPLMRAQLRSGHFIGVGERGLAVAKAGTGRLLNLPEMYRNELNCTHLPLNSGDF